MKKQKKLDITKTMTKNRYDEPIEACFVAVTKILSKRNKTIEKICVDDYVYLYNEIKNIVEEKRVKNILSRKVYEIYKIYIKGESKILRKEGKPDKIVTTIMNKVRVK